MIQLFDIIVLILYIEDIIHVIFIRFDIINRPMCCIIISIILLGVLNFKHYAVWI